MNPQNQMFSKESFGSIGMGNAASATQPNLRSRRADSSDTIEQLNDYQPHSSSGQQNISVINYNNPTI